MLFFSIHAAVIATPPHPITVYGQTAATPLKQTLTSLSALSSCSTFPHQQSALFYHGLEARFISILWEGQAMLQQPGTQTHYDGQTLSLGDRVELYPGPQSAKFGEGLGGIMNIIIDPPNETSIGSDYQAFNAQPKPGYGFKLRHRFSKEASGMVKHPCGFHMLRETNMYSHQDHPTMCNHAHNVHVRPCQALRIDANYSCTTLQAFQKTAQHEKVEGKAQLRFGRMRYRLQTMTDHQHHIATGFEADNFEIWGRFVQSPAKNILVFQSSAKHAINDHWTVFGHIGKSHRLPTHFERYSQPYGNANLVPEINYGLYTGMQYQNNRQKLECAFFFNRLKHLVGYEVVKRTYYNLNHYSNFGGDMRLQHQWSHKHASEIGVTYAHNATEQPLFYRPRLKTNLTHTMQVSEDLRAEMSMTYMSQHFVFNAQDEVISRKHCMSAQVRMVYKCRPRMQAYFQISTLRCGAIGAVWQFA